MSSISRLRRSKRQRASVNYTDEENINYLKRRNWRWQTQNLDIPVIFKNKVESQIHTIPVDILNGRGIITVTVNGKPHFELRTSTIDGAGLGLFAATLFKNGDIITKFLGPKATNIRSNYAFELRPGKVVDPPRELPYAFAHFINNKYDANAIVKSNGNVEATREILPDEEIFIYYGQDHILYTQQNTEMANVDEEMEDEELINSMDSNASVVNEDLSKEYNKFWDKYQNQYKSVWSQYEIKNKIDAFSSSTSYFYRSFIENELKESKATNIYGVDVKVYEDFFDTSDITDHEDDELYVFFHEQKGWGFLYFTKNDRDIRLKYMNEHYNDFDTESGYTELNSNYSNAGDTELNSLAPDIAVFEEEEEEEEDRLDLITYKDTTIMLPGDKENEWWNKADLKTYYLLISHMTDEAYNATIGKKLDDFKNLSRNEALDMVLRLLADSTLVAV